MRVTVDESICQGHTLCNMVAPEVFGLRVEDGHAVVLVSEPVGDQVDAARKAAATCPEQAIVISED
ncbi:MAG: ferredoxin [Acidimicrobiia bacterium]